MERAQQEVLRQRGAVLGEFLGCVLPARFTSVESEWRAARESCAVFDASFRCLVAATGRDRVSFLHGMLSNDIKSLEAGRGVHALQLDRSGKVVSDVRVYAERERLLLDVLAQRQAVMTQTLERFVIADDVELSLSTDEVPLVALEGPAADGALGELLGCTVPALRPLDHWRVAFRGVSLLVVGASELRGCGRMLCGPPAFGGSLFEAVCAAGVAPAGMEALEVLRIEAGVPRYGQDIDPECLAMEVGLEEAISFRKGCYLGQEVVERIAARGHVNRRLTGLVLDGDRLPQPGSALTRDGRPMGHLTSVVHSLALGRAIALGYVHRDAWEVGSRLQVLENEVASCATVVELPFACDEATPCKPNNRLAR